MSGLEPGQDAVELATLVVAVPKDRRHDVVAKRQRPNVCRRFRRRGPDRAPRRGASKPTPPAARRVAVEPKPPARWLCLFAGIGDEQRQMLPHRGHDAALFCLSFPDDISIHQRHRVGIRATAILHSPHGELVVVGQGYVGLPVAVRACEAGFDVVGLDVDADRVKRLEAGDSPVEDITAERLRRRPRHRPLPAQQRLGRLRRVRRRRHLGAHAAAGRQPRPLLHRGRRRGPRPATSTRGACVVLESTTYPGTTEELVAPILEAGSGLTAGRRLPPRLQPRAHRPRQPEVDLREHPQGRLGHRRRLARARCRAFYDRLVDRPCRSPAPRRPSSPSCSRTPSATSTSPWSTSWPCSPTTSASTSGRPSTPPPPSPSATCASRPGPGVGGHCLPIDPSYLSWRVRRLPRARPSASSSWPTTSTTTCPTTSCAASSWPSTTGAWRSRAAASCCSAWPTRRTPATPARPRPRPSPASSWPSAPTCGPPTPTSPTTSSPRR